MTNNKNKGPKVLFIDIETAPIRSYVWGIWQQNVGLNQIVEDWHLLSWAAKWQGDETIIYQDQRKIKNVENDKELLKGIWELLNEADIVIGHNSDQFDIKKLNARFIQNGFDPPSSYKKIDTLKIAKKHFKFTSNKLEHLADILKVEYKKDSHKKFPGFKLWEECLCGNKDAWPEMEKYNKQDVLVLEAVYDKLQAWSDTNVNFNVFTDDTITICRCGSTKFKRNGFYYTATSKFQRYKCSKCKAESRSGKNLLSKEKRESLKRNTTR